MLISRERAAFGVDLTPCRVVQSIPFVWVQVGERGPRPPSGFHAPTVDLGSTGTARRRGVRSRQGSGSEIELVVVHLLNLYTRSFSINGIDAGPQTCSRTHTVFSLSVPRFSVRV